MFDMVWIELGHQDVKDTEIVIIPMLSITAGWFTDGRYNIDYKAFDPVHILSKYHISGVDFINVVEFKKPFKGNLFDHSFRFYFSGEKLI